MNDSSRSCVGCIHWEPCSSTEGKCRRHAPAAALCPRTRESDSTAVWPSTLPEDWCGEWQSRDSSLAGDEFPMDSEEERSLRNASIAEALLILPSERRDAMLLEILTEDERQSPTPPDDFYERVQEYFAHRRDAESE